MGAPGVRLESGHVLDERYLLEEVIGQGGMGTVFAARHLELDERVAVKVLQSEEAVATMDAEHLERFLREARLAAKIKNDHVVRVIDVARGKNGSPPYIVMELLAGTSLAGLIDARGRLPFPEAVAYILQGCEAVAEAHALGIVHRDLKSSNLHISESTDGTPVVKVLDFGISKAADEAGDVSLTATSNVFGSPAYMSPEQIRSAKHVDARTDVWALAIVLYELLTGKLPFCGATATAMLAAISVDAPMPLTLFVPDAPRELEQAINDALVKDRDRRTPSVAAFARSIAPFAGAVGAASLVAVERIAARTRTGSVKSGTQPAPSRPSDIGPISDTMRASRSISGPVLPSSRPHSADAVGRTDRGIVVPAVPASSKTPLIAALFIGVCTAAVVSTAFLVLAPRLSQRDVRVAATPSAAVELPVVVMPAPPIVSAPVVSAIPSPSTTVAPPAKARPNPGRSPPKPNSNVDTSSRE